MAGREHKKQIASNMFSEVLEKGIVVEGVLAMRRISAKLITISLQFETRFRNHY